MVFWSRFDSIGSKNFKFRRYRFSFVSEREGSGGRGGGGGGSEASIGSEREEGGICIYTDRLRI